MKWWLLAVPHYLIVALFTGGFATTTGDASNMTQGGIGLIGVLVVVAGATLIFTGRYPRAMFDLVIGLKPWVYRVVAYAALMTDDYPPFRLDTGGTEPGTASGKSIPSPNPN